MRALLLTALLATPAAAADWPDTDGQFLTAVDQVRRLDRELLSRDSATATLQAWCDAQGSGGDRIVARRVRGVEKPAGPDERRDLKISASEPVAYRRVELACGDRVLSVADNWYLPGRLTPAMNTALNETQTPFGVVVRSLNYSRRTLATEILLQAREPMNPEEPGVLVFPHEVLRHRAVLSTPDGAPISLVVETYTDQILTAPP